MPIPVALWPFAQNVLDYDELSIENLVDGTWGEQNWHAGLRAGARRSL